MALIQTSGLISAISGKVGGVVFGNAAGGAWVRSWTQQTNRQNYARTRQRSFMNLCVAYWKTLTPEVKAVWASNTLNYPQTNRLGNEFFLTGYQFFLKLNLNLRSAGSNTWGDEQLQEILTDLDYSKELFMPTGIQVEFDPVVLPDNSMIEIYITAPCSPGQYTSPSLPYRLVKVSSTFVSNAIDCTDEYEDIYGIRSLPVGSYVYVYSRWIDMRNGLTGAKLYKGVQIPV